jgi:hypothetical protein
MQFMRIIASWAVKTEFGQSLMQNVTRDFEKGAEYRQQRLFRDREL